MIRRLGGDQLLCPAPGYDPHDRPLSVHLDVPSSLRGPGLRVDHGLGRGMA
jgi:hypothetical protein